MEDEIIKINKKITLSLEELKEFAKTIKDIVNDELGYNDFRVDITERGDIIIYTYFK